MHKIIFVFLFISTLASAQAQKQTFDVVSFAVPKLWQQQRNDASIQLSVSDKKTGAYAIVLITKASSSAALANENFSMEWTKFINGTVKINTEPVMQKPTSENGWDIITGSANYVDGGRNGVATLITATGGGQMTSIVLMTNTDKYQNELLSFIHSLSLAKQPSNVNNKFNTNKNTTNSAIVGMWVFYNTESGGNSNGFPQLTGGYMRREYVFNSDGTYIFRAKDWMVYVKDILFVYETGTYTVNGNQITITPKKGKGEWWSKVTNNTNAWGKLLRASTDYKLEKTAYTFEYYNATGNDEKVLILKSPKPTAREGNDGDNKAVQEFRYTSRERNASLINNPPGFNAF